MKAQQRRETFDALRKLDDSAQRLIIATGSYIGEGFDDARLDTLLLAAPVGSEAIPITSNAGLEYQQ